jgi:hypothetical protein
MIALILVLVIIGVALWLIETKVPMDPTIKVIIRVVVILCIALYLLSAFGILDMPVPRIR